MNLQITTQESLINEALTNRVGEMTSRIITQKEEVGNPLPLITLAAAKALTKIDDQTVANQITQILTEAAASVAVNFAISEQFKKRNVELENELDTVNDNYANLLEQSTRPADPIFEPVPDDELTDVAENKED